MSKTTTPWYSLNRLTPVALAMRPDAVAVNAASGYELLMFGDIGESWYEESITAKALVRELAVVDTEYIRVRMMTQGGSVPDGLAIFNALRNHPAHITTVNEGMVMSIGSLIMMAGDTIEMAENAVLMVHAPWVQTVGNATELREIADQLDTWARAMATSYAAKTGRPFEEMLALLSTKTDHYYTAAEALAAGFVDVVVSAAETFDGPLASARAALDGNKYRAMAAARSQAAATPAAPAAQLEMNPMPQAQTPAGTQPTAIDEQAIRAKAQAEALAADQQRRTGIVAAFKPFAGRPGVAELQAQCENDHAMSVEAAGNKLLAHLGSGATPLAGSYVAVTTVEDEKDKARKATAQALAFRAGLDKLDPTNPVRGETLVEMARASLVRAGMRLDGLDKMGVVAMAFTHSTSDFTGLLANVANKAMLMGVDEAEETFQLWTRRGTLTDFKPATRVGLNSFGSLPRVREGAEFTYGSMGDRANEIALAKYGRRFSITREAVINDDLSAFTNIPRAMGRAAIRTVGDLVYAVLTSNPTLKEDGKALFHADHSNLLTGAGISTASVDAMRVAMARQKLPGQSSGGSNIRLRYLLVPVSLEGTANVVANSEFEVGAASKNNTVPNSVRGTFQTISDARLDDASTTAWYGAASGTVNDTIEVAYLDGNDRPSLEQQAGWAVDGVEFKVRMEAGVAPLDFRGLARNPGA